MKLRKDDRECLLTAGSYASQHEDAVIAIHELYHQEPWSPIIIERSPRRSTTASSTIQRLLYMLLILVVAGCAIARCCHSGHSSHLPLPLASLSRWMERHTSGYSLPPLENMDERLDDDPANNPINNTTTRTQLTKRQIELELQLHELEFKIVEEDNNRLKVELLAELLKNHKLNRNHTAATIVEQRLRGLGAAKFEVGGVVEQMYNANTLKNRILYPFRVEEVHFSSWELDDVEENHHHQSLNEDWDRDSSDLRYTTAPPVGIRYTIVRLLDGFRVKQIPESFLRQYLPYPQDSKALCNVGGYGIGQERLVSCTIIDYILPPSKPLTGKEHVRIKKEEEVLKAEYRVRIRREEEDVEDNLPIGKAQRQLHP